ARDAHSQPVAHHLRANARLLPAIPLGEERDASMTASVRGAPTAAPPEVAVTIRPMVSVDDARACVDLQRDVWGWDQPEVVPATLLHVVDYVGGLAAGAFDSGGTMLGFVFGITGVRDGTVVHWSHMLG